MLAFYDYVLSFYGLDGIYPMGATFDQVVAATGQYIASGGDFAGDSFDREHVRDILISQHGLRWPEGR